MATHIGKPELEQLEVEDYASFRPRIKSGDIFFWKPLLRVLQND